MALLNIVGGPGPKGSERVLNQTSLVHCLKKDAGVHRVGGPKIEVLSSYDFEDDLGDGLGDEVSHNPLSGGVITTKGTLTSTPEEGNPIHEVGALEPDGNLRGDAEEEEKQMLQKISCPPSGNGDVVKGYGAHTETSTESETTHGRWCQVCERLSTVHYVCPKCSVVYCSLDCFRNHSASCVDKFYQQQVSFK